jgi:hypothetical protein
MRPAVGGGGVCGDVSGLTTWLTGCQTLSTQPSRATRGENQNESTSPSPFLTPPLLSLAAAELSLQRISDASVDLRGASERGAALTDRLKARMKEIEEVVHALAPANERSLLFYFISNGTASRRASTTLRLSARGLTRWRKRSPKCARWRRS